MPLIETATAKKIGAAFALAGAGAFGGIHVDNFFDTRERVIALEERADNAEDVRERVIGLENRVIRLEERTLHIQEDVTELKKDVSGLKDDVSELKADNARIHEKLDGIGKNIAELLARTK